MLMGVKKEKDQRDDGEIKEKKAMTKKMLMKNCRPAKWLVIEQKLNR